MSQKIKSWEGSINIGKNMKTKANTDVEKLGEGENKEKKYRSR